MLLIFVLVFPAVVAAREALAGVVASWGERTTLGDASRLLLRTLAACATVTTALTVAGIEVRHCAAPRARTMLSDGLPQRGLPPAWLP